MAKSKPVVKVGKIQQRILLMRTSNKKFRAALAAMFGWIKKDRSGLGTGALLTKLKGSCRGTGITTESAATMRC